MRAILLVMLSWLLLAAVGHAQEPREEPESVPRAVADELVEFFNAPSTMRFSGRSGVPAGSAVVGDVAVLGGPFTVAGRIEGRLVVLNGTLELLQGARVGGDVTVVGGRVLGRAEDALEGGLAVYPELLRVVERAGVVALSARQLRAFSREEGLGRTTFTVRAGTSYNRVEGLPVMFGPVFETAEPNSLKVEALGIWRTESGLSLDADELGYQLLVEQRLGRSRAASLGGTLHSTVSPIATQGVTDLESSLAIFFLHKDFRDYFERIGWSLYATAAVPRVPLALRLELAEEDHRFASVQSPWTLRRNDHAWRPQPLVAQGTLRTLAGELVYDARNEPRDPTDGWLARVRAVGGLGGTLLVPEHFSESAALPARRVEARPVSARFSAGLLDVRRYARVGPDSDVALRAFLGGALDDRPLPPQYQHALGGEGSVPGYALLSRDCGARSQVFSVEHGAGDTVRIERVYPSYGCDRVALLQLEYRRRLLFDLDLRPGEDGDWEWYPAVDLSPAWAFFFDLGRGWSNSDPALDTPWVSDLGLGFFLGDLGLYVARPLRGPDRGFNFFIRFHRRF